MFEPLYSYIANNCEYKHTTQYCIIHIYVFPIDVIEYCFDLQDGSRDKIVVALV